MIDDIRPADDSNPRGYYEYEPVKRLKEDAAWMGRARGRVIKIVAPLLRYLPWEFQYRIIIMERQLDQVLESQRLMLKRLGRPYPVRDDLALARIFTRDIKQAKIKLAQEEVPFVCVNYLDCLKNTSVIVTGLEKFLGGLEMEKMVEAVAPELQRTRKKQP